MKNNNAYMINLSLGALSSIFKIILWMFTIFLSMDSNPASTSPINFQFRQFHAIQLFIKLLLIILVPTENYFLLLVILIP